MKRYVPFIVFGAVLFFGLRRVKSGVRDELSSLRREVRGALVSFKAKYVESAGKAVASIVDVASVGESPYRYMSERFLGFIPPIVKGVYRGVTTEGNRYLTGFACKYGKVLAVRRDLVLVEGPAGERITIFRDWSEPEKEVEEKEKKEVDRSNKNV